MYAYSHVYTHITCMHTHITCMHTHITCMHTPMCTGCKSLQQSIWSQIDCARWNGSGIPRRDSYTFEMWAHGSGKLLSLSFFCLSVCVSGLSVGLSIWCVCRSVCRVCLSVSLSGLSVGLSVCWTYIHVYIHTHIQKCCAFGKSCTVMTFDGAYLSPHTHTHIHTYTHIQQCCAFGKSCTVMTFDGAYLSTTVLDTPAHPIYIVLVDLGAKKVLITRTSS
jgi:hypothetical protein